MYEVVFEICVTMTIGGFGFFWPRQFKPQAVYMYIYIYVYFVISARTLKSPKSAGKGGPGHLIYCRTTPGNLLFLKPRWGTGWPPSGCPGLNANFQCKIPSKNQTRIFGEN